MLSVAESSGTTEGSDSNNASVVEPQRNKRMRHESLVSSKFKGVVAQVNGHWGAQIYANHQRVWLGTFKSEREAAMLYDSAALRLRSGDPNRNFPMTEITPHELKFQERYSTEDILNMIKEGSYFTKLKNFVDNYSKNGEGRVEFGRGRPCDGGAFYHQLFQKELTPSDVGKLNRLVIPKKYAMKYFPKISENCSKENGNESGIDDMPLEFYDNNMKAWQFRYCYWKSSQSFVFTRGWNSFVRAKKLDAKDVITFYKCEYRHGINEGNALWMIGVDHNSSQHNTNDINNNDNSNSITNSNNQTSSDSAEAINENVEFQLGLGVNSGNGERTLVEEEAVELTLAQASVPPLQIH